MRVSNDGKKKMYGQFCRDVNSKTDKDKRWAWLKKGDLKPETEALYQT